MFKLFNGAYPHKQNIISERINIGRRERGNSQRAGAGSGNRTRAFSLGS